MRAGRRRNARRLVHSQTHRVTPSLVHQLRTATCCCHPTSTRGPPQVTVVSGAIARACVRRNLASSIILRGTFSMRAAFPMARSSEDMHGQASGTSQRLAYSLEKELSSWQLMHRRGRLAQKRPDDLLRSKRPARTA